MSFFKNDFEYFCLIVDGSKVVVQSCWSRVIFSQKVSKPTVNKVKRV